jgi:hypothetical protein
MEAGAGIADFAARLADDAIGSSETAWPTPLKPSAAHKLRTTLAISDRARIP